MVVLVDDIERLATFAAATNQVFTPLYFRLAFLLSDLVFHELPSAYISFKVLHPVHPLRNLALTFAVR